MNLFMEYLRRNLHHGSIALVTPDGSHYVLGHAGGAHKSHRLAPHWTAASRDNRLGLAGSS